MKKYVLKLYITGHTPRSEQAVANLERILSAPELVDDYELTVVDLMDDPQAAEEQKILATPTLVKELPLPSRRVIGDLSREDKIYFALDLSPPLRH